MNTQLQELLKKSKESEERFEKEKSALQQGIRHQAKAATNSQGHPETATTATNKDARDEARI